MNTRSAGRRPQPPAAGAGLSRIWHSLAFRNLLYQALVIGAVLLLGAFMIGNAQEAMSRRGISTGFGFLTDEAGFAIGESLIAYSSSDTYLRAYLVAVLNTLKVSVFAIVAATVLGTLLGIARLSRNWLIARLSSLYVELFRNTPQLVQVIFWYVLVTHLPAVRQALSPWPGVYLSNRGLTFPALVDHPAHAWMLVALLLGAGAMWGFMRWADRRRRRTGHRVALLWPVLGLLLGPPGLVWLLAGMPHVLDVPELRGFNFVGGLTASPEFLAIFLGLSLYIAAFIAEIVRSGIQSVGRGQREAASAISLGPGDTYRKIILPQALRVIVPAVGGQYVSLTKNSSLGVAIGYPELFNINNTIITSSGHAVEAVGIMMVVYLSISFILSAGINWYNRLVQIKER